MKQVAQMFKARDVKRLQDAASIADGKIRRRALDDVINVIKMENPHMFRKDGERMISFLAVLGVPSFELQ